MLIRIGLDNNIEGRSLAWALDFPGCFAYGEDKTEAMINLPRALLEYEAWINSHTNYPWLSFDDLDLRVVEHFTTFRLGEDYMPAPPGEGYEINAWFTDDWRPLSTQEINQCSQIFNWQRDELLAGLSTLDAGLLNIERPGQRWTIIEIAKHIANAELWYLQRLGLTGFSRKNLSADYETRLTQTSTLINQIFPTFADQINVKGIDGEFWSYRKIVRRTLWHQRDHIEHIKQLAFNKQ